MFDANDFLCTMGSIPATDGILFSHERFLNRTLAQHIFTGRNVFIHNEKISSAMTDGEKVRGIVEAVCSDQASVRLESSQNHQFIHLDRIALDESSFEINNELCDILTNNRALLKQKLVDLIRIGDFFELQEKNTLALHTVKILANHSGFVLVVNERGVREFVHLTDVRCHPLGWSQTPAACGNGYTVVGHAPGPTEATPAVPHYFFEYATLEEHHLWPGMLLEALDPENRMMFYPALVTERLNRHFFTIRLVRDLTCNAKLKHSPKVQMCHLGSPDIFPMGWCSKNGIRLSVPKGLECFSLANLWDGLRMKLKTLQIEVKPTPSFGQLEQPPSVGKIAAVRYCEFYNNYGSDKLPGFVPAVILRSVKHLLWINVDNEDQLTPPKIFSVFSDRLYRWGFANKAGFNFIMNRSLPQISLCDISAKFTSQRTSIFENNKRNFMSDLWLNGQLWLKHLHVNKSCFYGPFLDAKKVRQLPASFTPGPLPFLITEVIRELTLCANRVTQVMDILRAGKNTVMPTLEIKLNRKSGTRRNTFHVEVCQQVIEFSGWLQNVLLRLDACPYLISLEEVSDRCEAKCASLAALSYMNFDQHPNTNITMSAVPTQKMMQVQRRQQGRSNASEPNALNITTAEKTPAAAKIKRISAPTRDTHSSADEDEDDEVAEINRRQSTHTSPSADDDNHSAMLHNCYDSPPKVERMDLKTLVFANSEPTFGSVCTRSMARYGSNERTISVVPTEIATRKDEEMKPRRRPGRPKLSTTLSKCANSSMMMASITTTSAVLQQNGTPINVVAGAPASQLAASSTTTLAMIGTRLVAVNDAKYARSFRDRQQGQLWKTTSSPPSPPTKRLKHCYPAIESNPMGWNCEELCAWIANADPRLRDIAKQLADEEVDGEAIMMFKASTFAELGIKLGPAVKILALIEELKRVVIKEMDQ